MAACSRPVTQVGRRLDDPTRRRGDTPDRRRTPGRSGGCFRVVQPRRHDDGDVVAEQHIAVGLDRRSGVSARARSPAAGSRMQRCASTCPTTPMRRPRAPNSRDLTLVKATRDTGSGRPGTPPTGISPTMTRFATKAQRDAVTANRSVVAQPIGHGTASTWPTGVIGSLGRPQPPGQGLLPPPARGHTEPQAGAPRRPARNRRSVLCTCRRVRPAPTRQRRRSAPGRYVLVVRKRRVRGSGNRCGAERPRITRRRV